MDDIDDSASLLSDKPNIFETYRKPIKKSILMSEQEDEEMSSKLKSRKVLDLQESQLVVVPPISGI